MQNLPEHVAGAFASETLAKDPVAELDVLDVDGLLSKLGRCFVELINRMDYLADDFHCRLSQSAKC